MELCNQSSESRQIFKLCSMQTTRGYYRLHTRQVRTISGRNAILEKLLFVLTEYLLSFLSLLSPFSCFRCYHFSCSEDTGWRFDRDGKVYYCDLHRNHSKAEEADKVSLAFYRSKTPYAVIRCFLCGGPEHDSKAGNLFSFQRKNRRVLIHEKCARYTNIVDVKEETEERTGSEFKNIFEAIEKATSCSRCGRHGATIKCANCDQSYHLGCGEETGWKFDKRKRLHFRCEQHRVSGSDPTATAPPPQNKFNDDVKQAEADGGGFQHALFSMGGGPTKSSTTSMPSNSEVGGLLQKNDSREEVYISDDSSDSEFTFHSDDGKFNPKRGDVSLAVPSEESFQDNVHLETKRVRVERTTVQDPWTISLVAIKEQNSDKHLLKVDSSKPGTSSTSTTLSLESGDIIKSINGLKIGMEQLGTLKKVLAQLEKQVFLLVEVIREKVPDSKESKDDEEEEPKASLTPNEVNDNKPEAEEVSKESPKSDDKANHEDESTEKQKEERGSDSNSRTPTTSAVTKEEN